MTVAHDGLTGFVVRGTAAKIPAQPPTAAKAPTGTVTVTYRNLLPLTLDWEFLGDCRPTSLLPPAITVECAVTAADPTFEIHSNLGLGIDPSIEMVLAPSDDTWVDKQNDNNTATWSRP